MKSVVSEKESLCHRAGFLRLASRTLSENMKSGNFRSLYRGQGIEFSGVRDYIRGDDIRSIDWNVTARLGKPFVKMFEEERELNVFFVIDCSASLFEGSPKKIDAAVESAALLAFAAEHNSCPVGCVFFDGEVRFPLAPKSGSEQVMVLIKKLDDLADFANSFHNNANKIVPGSNLTGALNVAGSLLKKRSLVFVISDFRVAGSEAALVRLAHKHDCVAVRVSAQQDKKLPDVGTVSFLDSESGTQKLLPTSSAALAKAWRQAATARTTKWHETCAKRGVLTLELSTEDDVAQKLMAFFSQKRLAV